ncbi:MAG: hypothetical protein ACEY3H_02525 [Wolbachia sp.]|nr:hypothetical protein [Wolbachia endosymbiont (group A) of Tiphia femorata]
MQFAGNLRGRWCHPSSPYDVIPVWNPEKFACKLVWKVADLTLNECF